MLNLEPVSDAAGEAIGQRFLEFLNQYREQDELVYAALATKMVVNEKTSLIVNMNHLVEWDDLKTFIYSDFYRYEPYLSRAVTSFITDKHPDYAREKTFSVGFSHHQSVGTLRALTATEVGTLMALTGTVTRTTEVRPELLYATFRCEACNTVVADVPQQFKYTEPQVCPNGHCGNRSRWELMMEKSTFADWQKIRIQEHSSQIPAGSVPRSLDMILRHDMVDMAKPGDNLLFTGSLIVVPDIASLMKPGERQQTSFRSEGKRKEHNLDSITGLKALGVRDLSYKLCFLVNCVRRQNWLPLEEEMEHELSFADQEQIIAMRQEPDLYSRLANSIAPTVIGHDEIKRGILLMLVGGVTKKTPEGMKLRGDINCCIVGDPSTAKSQFLKYVNTLIPRSVYTSGKASTAAGLTAAVQRDSETGDFCIEAGALMLADNGICCIDEFDKMDPKDQVAIHEAMEQQTISIAKAGIQASLNARTSILAAANPIFGRYDKSKSLRFNVNMPPPLMSRFDLFFVVVDEGQSDFDRNIAEHIVNLHTFGDRAAGPDFTTDQLQNYIQFAKSLKPHFTEEAAMHLREQYKRLRQKDITSGGKAYRITVRQLESLVRLSEAVAKINCDKFIRKQYVEEACRLLDKSIIKVEREDINLSDQLDESDMNKFRAEQAEIAVQKLADDRAKEQPQRMTITFDEYERMVKSICIYIREKAQDPDYANGLEQIDILNWYVEQNMDQINNEQEANDMSALVASVIQRLLTRDRILVVTQDDVTDRNNRKLAVHVNYSLD